MIKKYFVTAISFLAIFIAAMASSADTYDINIDATSPFLYPEYSKRISMDFQEASLVDVLKIFSQQTSLNLITSEDISGKKITVYLDNVPVEQALEQVLRANNLIYELQPGSNIYIVKTLTSPEVELITRVYQLRHASVNSAKINQTLFFENMRSTGAGSTSEDEGGIYYAIEAILTPDGKIVEDPRTNSLIVTDIATNFSMIEQTISRLDIPVAQILIEVEMLEVTKDTADKIGVKMGETPLTFTGAERDHVYPWNQNRLLDKGLISDPAYRVGTIDASGFAATLQFLKTQSDTKNLARPRILTLNNQPAQIKIATDEAIGLINEQSSGGDLTVQALEPERIETGVFLTVTPQANVLTGEIILALDPKFVVTRTGATFGNTTFRDPEERSSKSIIRVKSGNTVILGGLLRDDISITVTKVPILGDIPLIGHAFRHKNETTKKRELIIFITPYILKENTSPKTSMANSRKIIREQDIPLKILEYTAQKFAVAEN